MNKKMEWINFGDVNPLEHDGMWVAKTEDSNVYFVVELRKIENEYVIKSGIVHLDDEWINWNEIESLCGEIENDEHVKAMLVALCYPSDIYGYNDDRFTNKKQVRSYLKNNLEISIPYFEKVSMLCKHETYIGKFTPNKEYKGKLKNGWITVKDDLGNKVMLDKNKINDDFITVIR